MSGSGSSFGSDVGRKWGVCLRDFRPWFAYLKLLNSAVSKLPNVKCKVWCGVDKDVRSFGIEYTCCESIEEVIFMPGATFQVVSEQSRDHGDWHTIRLQEIETNDKDEDERNFVKDESKEQRNSKPTIANSIAHKFGKSNSEDQEFAEPAEGIKLFCEGRPCAKCHKCRDWKCSNDPPLWDWLYKYEEWDNNEWNLWRHERYKFFIKRDGATCSCYFLALYLNYGRDVHDAGADYRHICLCERY
ncbi:hypothetical protein I4U23_004942 [Adineta vaga]|nr:hypothetical protein I4U23_004942 [Adineta vaga]